MGNTPFKLKGWSPFTKKSPAKDDPEATHPEHHETKKPDPFAYEKELEKEDPKTLTHEQKRILSKYAGRKKKAEGN